MIDKEEIIFGEKNGIKYLQFKKLLKYPEIQHLYILKSKDMNFRLGTNKRRIKEVTENIKKVCNEFEIPLDSIIRPDYNHTNNVQIIDFVDKNEVPEISGKRFKNTDGLITNKNNITMMSTNADCNLILIYDPIKHVVGNIHAGWRGTFDRIAYNAVEKMKNEFGSNPKDILCFLCPSIRKCHFEVDEDVKNICEEKFKYTKLLNKIIEEGEIKENKKKYFIDTILINKLLLEEAGVSLENIVDSEICSVCHMDIIHSKRAEGENFGLGAAFIRKNK